MPTFLIERNLPGASNLTAEELKAIARTSNAVVDNLGVPYTWQQSYLAGDKIYCASRDFPARHWPRRRRCGRAIAVDSDRRLPTALIARRQ